jgi:hypothetical protein
MKVRQIAINFFSNRERQMTSNYLAMLVTFAHLAIKERRIASNFQDHRHTHLAINERQTASKYLAIHGCQIASMSYQLNYSKREYFVSHTWDI